MEQLPDQPQLKLQGPPEQRELRGLHAELPAGRTDHQRAQSRPLRLLSLLQTGPSQYSEQWRQMSVQVLGNLSTWQHPVIILKDIQYKELSGIVEFIYHGEVSIDQECLPSFLHAAESLRIKGLTEDKKVNVSLRPPPDSHSPFTEQRRQKQSRN